MFDMGKRICKLRRDAHLSQKQLGEKIGKSASTIGSYENDTAVPTLENAAALAEALHVSLDYLLYGEKSRTLPLQKMSENRVQLLTDLGLYGIRCLPETRKTDAKGNTKAIYIDGEFGGFAIHLVRR